MARMIMERANTFSNSTQYKVLFMTVGIFFIKTLCSRRTKDPGLIGSIYLWWSQRMTYYALQDQVSI